MKLETLNTIRILLASASRNARQRLKLGQAAGQAFDRRLNPENRQEFRTLAHFTATELAKGTLDPVSVAHEAALQIEKAEGQLVKLEERVSAIGRELDLAQAELALRPTSQNMRALENELRTLRQELNTRESELGGLTDRLEAENRRLNDELDRRPTTQTFESLSEQFAQCREKSEQLGRQLAYLQSLPQTSELAELQRGLTEAGEQLIQWQDYAARLESDLKTARASASRVTLFGQDHGRPNKRTAGQTGFFGNGELALITHVGRTRKENQDSVGYTRLLDGREVVIVADGMGGHAGGALASRLIIEHFLNALESGATIREAVLAANRNTALHPESEPGGGSTLVAAIIDREQKVLQVVQVGDSRAKLIQPDAAYYLTLDHSLKFLVYAKQEDASLSLPLTERQMEQLEGFLFEASNVITACLGRTNLKEGNLHSPRISILEAPLREASEPSTLVVYCDGLVDHTSETAQTALARQYPSAEEIARVLLNNALQSSSDNISAAVLRLPFTLDLDNVRVQDYPAEIDPNPITKGRRDEFARLLVSLQPRQTVWLVDKLSYTNLTLEQVGHLPLSQQLQLLRAPLNMEVHEQLLNHLAQQRFTEVQPYLSEATGEVRSGAELVLERWLRARLETMASHPEVKQGLSEQINSFKNKDHRKTARVILKQIESNDSGSPMIRTLARVAAEGIKTSWW